MNASRPHPDCDFEEARLLQHKLREVLGRGSRAVSDEESLQTVQRLCDRAVLALTDEYCQEQLCEIERQARKLFSGGPLPFRRRLILDALEAINERLSGLEALQRAEGVDAAAEVSFQTH